jgi:hypothetical protein
MAAELAWQFGNLVSAAKDEPRVVDANSAAMTGVLEM